MRRLGYRVVDRIVEHFETRRRASSDPRRRRGRAAGGARRPAAEEPGDPRRRARRAASSRCCRSSSAPTTRASSPASAARATSSRARRRRRVGLQRLRRLVDGRLGPGDGRARRARLAARAVRPARGHRGRARQRRLGRRAWSRSRPPARAATGRRRTRSSTSPSEGHASITRALRLLGLRYVVVPARDDQRLHADDVRAAIEGPGGAAVLRRRDGRHDEHRRRRPAGRAGRARASGSTSTAPTARRPRWPAPLTGLDRADSLVLDPHKWLFQPYEIGCVLMREPGLLERTFSLSGVYLRDTRRRRGQLPRPLRPAHAQPRARSSCGCRSASSASPPSARRSPTGSRSPSTRRRRCAPGRAGRSSRRPSSRSSASAARASTRPAWRPPWSRTASPRRARPSSTAASSLRLCTINPRTTFERHRAHDRADGGGIRILRLS